jgi:tRNA-dihydrouridine synthase B
MTIDPNLPQNRPLPSLLNSHRPITALAPMQDVTTLGFIRLLTDYGAPDLFFTEYFRVHAHSKPEAHIVQCILEHGPNYPVFAQMIGESIPDLLRTAFALTSLPVAGVDLNMGCPAPKVYKKNVGGGLLRDPVAVERLLPALREGIKGRFTVKMRIGFENTDHFQRLLQAVADNHVDLLTVHGRTVKGGYRSEVDYESIQQAVKSVTCPVLANGNISSAIKAESVIQNTHAHGVMVGRACIRNPWIFRQIHQRWSGTPVFYPTLRDVRIYIEELYFAVTEASQPETYRMARFKKFLNFIGVAIDSKGAFLYHSRRLKKFSELQSLADHYLINQGKSEQLYPDEPWPGLIARPNCEGALNDSCD